MRQLNGALQRPSARHTVEPGDGRVIGQMWLLTVNKRSNNRLKLAARGGPRWMGGGAGAPQLSRGVRRRISRLAELRDEEMSVLRRRHSGHRYQGPA